MGTARNPLNQVPWGSQTGNPIWKLTVVEQGQQSSDTGTGVGRWDKHGLGSWGSHGVSSVFKGTERNLDSPHSIFTPSLCPQGFKCGSAGKESACNAEDLGSIPGLGRSPGEGNSYPLQYSGLENSMDCIVHGVAKNQTQLSDFHFAHSAFKRKVSMGTHTEHALLGG